MTTPLLFLDVGGGEILLIFVVVLVFFGPGKIPELARGLGKGIREFKDASNEIRSEFERVAAQPAPPVAHAAHEPYNESPTTTHETASAVAVAADYASALPTAEDSDPSAVALPVAEDAAETAPPPVVVVGGVPGTRARGTQHPAPTDA